MTRIQFQAIVSLSAIITVSLLISTHFQHRTHHHVGHVYASLSPPLNEQHQMSVPTELQKTGETNRLPGFAQQKQQPEYIQPNDSAHAVTSRGSHSVEESSSWRRTVVRHQQERQQAIRAFCDDPTRRLAIDRNNLFQVVFSPRLEFAYCAIGKVASTAWFMILKRALGDRSAHRFSGRFRRLRTPRTSKIKNFFKFVFVRHPFDRLLSAYFSKFRKESGYWRDVVPHIVHKYRHNSTRARTQSSDEGSNSTSVSDLHSGTRLRGKSSGSPEDGSNLVQRQTYKVTFAEFVQYLIDSNPSAEHDFHWTPQSVLCQPCRVRYDFIGHYETLYDDAEFVLRKLGIFNTDRLKHVSRTFNRQNDRTKLKIPVKRIKAMFAQISTENVKRLKEIYRNDLNIFAYDSVL